MKFLVATLLIALVASAICVPVMVPTEGKSLEVKISDDEKSGDLEGAASAYVVYPHYPIYPYYHHAYHYPYVLYGK